MRVVARMRAEPKIETALPMWSSVPNPACSCPDAHALGIGELGEMAVVSASQLLVESGRVTWRVRLFSHAISVTP
jgi:hypothetical protein